MVLVAPCSFLYFCMCAVAGSSSFLGVRGWWLWYLLFFGARFFLQCRNLKPTGSEAESVFSQSFQRRRPLVGRLSTVWGSSLRGVATWSSQLGTSTHCRGTWWWSLACLWETVAVQAVVQTFVAGVVALRWWWCCSRVSVKSRGSRVVACGGSLARSSLSGHALGRCLLLLSFRLLVPLPGLR